jgi:hypothetical protein
MKRNYWYTGLSKWFKKHIIGPTGSGVRAKDSRGRFVADDKSTSNVNEAYKDGKKPPKKKAQSKNGRRKPKRRGRPKGSKNKKK